jgi:hypothetical protein
MMHDPFQNYATLGAYSGIPSPLGGGISPFGQPQGLQGIGYGGVNPHQLQLAALLAAQQGTPQSGGLNAGWQNPLASIGLQNPVVMQALQNPLVLQALQNPFVLQALQNPLVHQGLQNPLLNPIVAQYYQSQYPQMGTGGQQPFGQSGSPFGQTGSPFGQLAPQSWIGQQGFGGGSPFGYSHPLLSQWGGRGIQGHGMSPWSGY